MSQHTPARTRGEVIGRGGRWLAEWSLRIILIFGALWLIDYLLGKIWVVVLPVLIATIMATVLWPISGWMQRHKVPPAVAALTTMVGGVVVLAGVIAGIVPSVMDQIGPLADRTVEGVTKVQEWLTGSPFNVRPEQMNEAVHAITSKVQSSAATIAQGVFSGVSTAGSVVVTLLLIVVLVFFFIKDGPKFLPWMHRSTGGPASHHVEEVLQRMWSTLGGFIRTQAVVAFIDALFIGVGLVIIGVPLAGVLAVITFFGGFIPIVGAFVAGALAVLVALVANGWTTALIVLALIVAVQQLEGNVLSPMLQSRSMDLHPVVVLLAVTAGGSLWGIVGAFLAVPVAAVVAVFVRYISEHVDAQVTPIPAGSGVSLPDASGTGDAGNPAAELPSGESDVAEPSDAGSPLTRWFRRRRR
ncbi:AI-2E family transporter [Tomitella fengzijianii]|uniref:AI-2E family transporter n=1 Tax=Tomitella fengzijianii TaxID=2597660 RepID=A0A516X254_9ACTN|nr:AI-2E family transporter [Tomitella fengzijianii]QDQ97162.1 AI-2E family transporter [Tomitella fengzijianii]